MHKASFLLLGVALSMLPGLAVAEEQVIRMKGSDTLFLVAQAWAEVYDNIHPEVTVSVGGGGSGTGFAALLNGTADIANASRKIDAPEMEHARRLKLNPTEHIVGYDALAVYLHNSNPLKSITQSQLAEIFGRNGTIKYWTDLGIKVPGCKDQRIVRAGRQNNSGTYVYFRNTILEKKRRFDLGILDMLSSKDVVHLVEKTPCAIGYSGLAYATPKVRLMCVAKSSEGKCVVPSVNTAVDGRYPIARPLFMYTKGVPTGETKNYLDWIMSDDGQCIIKRKGYAPIRQVVCN